MKLHAISYSLVADIVIFLILLFTSQRIPLLSLENIMLLSVMPSVLAAGLFLTNKGRRTKKRDESYTKKMNALLTLGMFLLSAYVGVQAYSHFTAEKTDGYICNSGVVFLVLSLIILVVAVKQLAWCIKKD